MFPKFSRASGLLTLFLLVLLAFSPVARAQTGVIVSDTVDKSFVATLTMAATNTGYVMDAGPRVSVGNQQALVVDLVNTATPTLSNANADMGTMKVELCGHVASSTTAAATTEFRVIETWTSYGKKEVSTRGLGEIFFRIRYTSADTNAHKIYGRWRDD